ncbi:MAG TPA: hypothetical protein VJQ52_06045 [Steroidobacteraceae bacterium]|nr:hypothetical protein [Steroidobacteraceae bacterium]
MDRGVIVGGGLIAASFLVAVLLNSSEREEPVPVKAAAPAPVHACRDSTQRPPRTTPARDETDDNCNRPAAEPIKP